MYNKRTGFSLKFTSGTIAAVLTLFIGTMSLSAAGTSPTGTLCTSKKTGAVRWTSASKCRSTERIYSPTASASVAGPQGERGPTGAAGANGTNGINGTNGNDGLDGLPGAQGPQGEPGLTGNITGRTIHTQFPTNDGFYPSAAFGVDGLPIIAAAASGHHLRIVHCVDMSCTHTPTVTDYDANVASTGYYSSIIVSPADGLALVGYYDETNSALRVLHCNNVACTEGTLTTIESGTSAGRYGISVAVGADGLGIIAYYKFDTTDLKVAHCAVESCATFTRTVVDSVGNVGGWNSMAIGSDGLPLISYFDATGKNLKVAHCTDVACSSSTVSTVDSTNDVGYSTSLAIGLDGLGIISHVDTTNRAVRITHCSDLACTTGTSVSLSSAGFGTFETSLAIGRNGFPIVVHRLSEQVGPWIVKVTACADQFCLFSSTYTIVPESYAGELIDAKITVAPDGLPFIVGQGSNVGGNVRHLSTYHCGTITCSPWIGRNR